MNTKARKINPAGLLETAKDVTTKDDWELESDDAPQSPKRILHKRLNRIGAADMCEFLAASYLEAADTTVKMPHPLRLAIVHDDLQTCNYQGHVVSFNALRVAQSLALSAVNEYDPLMGRGPHMCRQKTRNMKRLVAVLQAYIAALESVDAQVFEATKKGTASIKQHKVNDILAETLPSTINPDKD